MRILFFLLFFLAACVRVESQPDSGIFIEKNVDGFTETIKQASAPISRIAAKELLYITDRSEIIRHTLKQDVIIRNPSNSEIVLTRLCTNIYDHFGNIAKKDVLLAVTPIPAFGEKYIRRDIYTEPTQSKIPKGYDIEICGAEYGEGSGSEM